MPSEGTNNIDFHFLMHESLCPARNKLTKVGSLEQALWIKFCLELKWARISAKMRGCLWIAGCVSSSLQRTRPAPNVMTRLKCDKLSLGVTWD